VQEHRLEIKPSANLQKVIGLMLLLCTETLNSEEIGALLENK
jgi:hypothetical protein